MTGVGQHREYIPFKDVGLSHELEYVLGWELFRGNWRGSMMHNVTENSEIQSDVGQGGKGDVLGVILHSGNSGHFFMTDKYQVIYADPPWDYGSAMQLQGAMTYPVIKTEEMIKGPIGDFVRSLHDPETGSVLLMWCTYPKVAEGLKLMAGWNYEYVSTWCTWVKLTKDGSKIKTGTGWWARANAEYIMLGVRKAKGGRKSVRQQVKNPDMNNMNSVLMAPAGKHSAKPHEIYGRIDTFFQAHTRKIELFARAPFYEGSNWSFWGNEVPGYPKTFSPRRCDEKAEEEASPMEVGGVQG